MLVYWTKVSHHSTVKAAVVLCVIIKNYKTLINHCTKNESTNQNRAAVKTLVVNLS